ANLLVVLGHHLSSADVLALPHALRSRAAPELAAAIRALDAALSVSHPESQDDQDWRMWVLQSGGAPVTDPEAVWADGKIILVRHPAESVDLYVSRRCCS